MTTNLTVRSTPQLTIQDVKQYLCPQANDKEIFQFIQLCRSQGLNPWIREAYLIKYGTSPANMVVGKDVFTKRAQAHPKFKGMSAGIIGEKQGELKSFTGSILPKNWVLVGGWAKVFVDGYVEPIEAQVSMAEYSSPSKEKSGKPNSWDKIPATMIRKVALVQALREAFPEELGGLYDSSEMGTDLPTSEPVKVDSKPPVYETTYESEAPVDYNADDLPPFPDQEYDVPKEAHEVCQFGKRKGVKWVDMDVTTLQGYVEYMKKQILDPNFSKFKSKNEIVLNCILNVIEDKEGVQ